MTEQSSNPARRPSVTPTWHSQSGPLDLSVWVEPDAPGPGEFVEFMIWASDERGGFLAIGATIDGQGAEAIPAAPNIDCESEGASSKGDIETSRTISHTFTRAGRYRVVIAATSGDCSYSDAISISEELEVR